MVTNRMKAAVKFIELWLPVKFDGNINCFQEVSSFLSIYLNDAKTLSVEAESEYSSWKWEKLLE
jgi:hypothetical protein